MADGGTVVDHHWLQTLLFRLREFMRLGGKKEELMALLRTPAMMNLINDATFGTNEDRSTPPPAGFEFLDQYVSFLGTPGEGRLIWRQDQWGVPNPTSPEEVEKQRVIKDKLHRPKDTLVRFSIRIANWLAYWLVADYAYNMMRSGSRLSGSSLLVASSSALLLRLTLMCPPLRCSPASGCFCCFC
jgi:hypothetical protein